VPLPAPVSVLVPAFAIQPFAALTQEPPQTLVVAVGLGSGGVVGAQPARGVVGALPPGVDLHRRIAAERATGRSGELTTVRLGGPAESAVLALGLGAGSPNDVRRAGAALARRLAGKQQQVQVQVLLGSSPADGALAAFIDGYALAAYAPPRSGIKQPDSAAPDLTLVVRDPDRFTTVVDRAVAVARAVYLARDVTQVPANLKSPQWLADRAVAVAAATGLTSRVRDEVELRAEGFGGLIGVGQASVRPPRFVELGYVPTGTSRRDTRRLDHVVLVGKGITFDSGGISIKPAAGMELMKTDLGGAAAVLGTMSALADLAIPVRVTGLLAIAENLPGADAMRPGDVITPYGGARTVEVLNTDAEGRLVLADALAYADRALDPDVVVDLATLTGAATLALGRRDAPLFASDDRLAAGLERAAAATGERVWRMPLVDDYRSAISSGVADLANAATGGVGAGAVMAALFLREFTGGRPWAHLDIAGTGRSDRDVDELCKGGTGYGVRLLLSWLQDR